MLAAGYVAFAAWPVITLQSNVKSALEDAVPVLYRANLLPEPDCTIGSDEVRRALIEKLTALGIVDPEQAITITRNASLVAIEVNVATALDLKLLHKKVPVTFHPRVETSAARVSY